MAVFCSASRRCRNTPPPRVSWPNRPIPSASTGTALGLAGLGAQRGGQPRSASSAERDTAGEVAQVLQRPRGVCSDLADDPPGVRQVLVKRGVGKPGLDGQGHQILLRRRGGCVPAAARVLSCAVTSPLPGGPRVLDQPGGGQHQPAWEATSARRLPLAPRCRRTLTVNRARDFHRPAATTMTGKAKTGNLSESDRKTSRRHGCEPP